MLTFQDYEKAVAEGEQVSFLTKVIRGHTSSEPFKTACDADEYNHQRDVTVNNYTRFIAEHFGNDLVDVTAANNRISSNFFHRLNIQRCTYSLGNGVSFSRTEEKTDKKGKVVKIDVIKRALGPHFDRDFFRLAYYSMIHRESFGFWDGGRLHIFPLTEFVPMYDEHTGAMRAGVRFWRIDARKPLNAVLYEENGYTVFRSDGASDILREVEPRRPYIVRGYRTEADGFVVTGYDNYTTLPVIHMKGSDLYQSTLVGMRKRIDSFDLIQSGFANDLQDCAQIYWIIENCGGMTEADLRAFLNKLYKDHIATADTSGMGADSSSLKPYVQEVPYQSRMAYLDHIRKAIYEDFGALDVHAVSANSTNDHLDAAYQPVDENADDFEYQCIEAIQQLLQIIGITGEDTMPLFKRNRICNQLEQTQMVMLASEYLDDEAALEHLPFITPDEKDGILARRAAETDERFDSEESDTDDDAEEKGTASDSDRKNDAGNGGKMNA